MTLDEVKSLVTEIVECDPRAKLFTGDLDEFYCDAVDDNGRGRILVWINYRDTQGKAERTLARFKTYSDADAFMAALSDTGVRRADEFSGT